jgi:ABC-type transporter Mla MlaB component
LYLKGSATLIKLPALASELETLKPNANVRVHIGDLDYIDHACIDLLTNWDKQRKATGGSLEIEWDELKNRYDRRSGTPEAKAARSTKPA